MAVLYDAPGESRWITVTQEGTVRFLLLDGCEEGAIDLASDEPVFEYVWLHKLSALCPRRPARFLVLGAGAFAAARCLALDHPGATVDVIDPEPGLYAVGLRFFGLDRPEFRGITFHATTAEDFLRSRPPTYDLIFDDTFEAFEQVPERCRNREHFRRLRDSLGAGGVCAKNLIWDPHRRATHSSCAEAVAGLHSEFPRNAVLALGDPAGGHNLMLVGFRSDGGLGWPAVREKLAAAGVPSAVLRKLRPRKLPLEV